MVPGVNPIKLFVVDICTLFRKLGCFITVNAFIMSIVNGYIILSVSEWLKKSYNCL